MVYKLNFYLHKEEKNKKHTHIIKITNGRHILLGLIRSQKCSELYRYIKEKLVSLPTIDRYVTIEYHQN